MNVYKSSFVHDFIDLNVAMWTSNNALTPDPEKEDNLASLPRQWAALSVGLRMCGWGDDAVKFFLLGNPLVWWGSLASVLLFLVVTLVYLIRAKRRIVDFSEGI